MTRHWAHIDFGIGDRPVVKPSPTDHAHSRRRTFSIGDEESGTRVSVSGSLAQLESIAEQIRALVLFDRDMAAVPEADRCGFTSHADEVEAAAAHHQLLEQSGAL